MLSTDISDKIVIILSQEDGVGALFLFGSHARGQDFPWSDIDIAIAPKQIGDKLNLPELQTKLIMAGLDNVDLSVVDGDNVVFAHEATKHHQVLYVAPGFELGEFILRLRNLYFDFRPYVLRQRAALKERFTNG